MTDTYIKSHILIDRDGYNARAAQGGYEDARRFTGLSIEQAPPYFDLFWMFMERVGGPWRWPLRRTYHENRESWEALMLHEGSKLFILRKDKQPIGFCFVATPRGKDRNAIETAQPGIDLNQVVEIEKFGLFIEETGKGYGRYFLHGLFQRLLVDHAHVYLNTRDTNHRGVIPFYERMGMKVIHQERLESDLLEPIRITRAA